MANKITICSTAAVLIGDEVISAVPGSSRASQVCDVIYDNTVNQLLALHPWKFAKAQFSLNRLTAVPVFSEYKYAFQLPSDFQRAIRTEYKTDYRIHQRYLYSNHPSVNLEYGILPSEGQWPDYFVRVVELKLAQFLAIAVAEDNTKMELIKAEYALAFMQAKGIDSQDQPPSRINADILLRARETGYDEDF